MEVKIRCRSKGKEYRTVLSCLMRGEERRLRIAGEVNGTADKAALTGVVEGLKRLNRPVDLCIVTDSDYVYAPIHMGWINTWKEKGWINTKGQLVRNQELWSEFFRLLEEQHSYQIRLEKKSGIRDGNGGS